MAPQRPTKTNKPKQPKGTTRRTQHIWTNFELHMLFCLICKGMHITGASADDIFSTVTAPKTDAKTQARAWARANTNSVSEQIQTQIQAQAQSDEQEREISGDVLFGRLAATAAVQARRTSALKTGRTAAGIPHPHVDVATALNRGLFGARNFKDDIPVEEVSAMIEFQLKERPAAKAFLERVQGGRVTRLKRRVWERGLRFTGSKAEWEEGKRRDREMAAIAAIAAAHVAHADNDDDPAAAEADVDAFEAGAYAFGNMDVDVRMARTEAEVGEMDEGFVAAMHAAGAGTGAGMNIDDEDEAVVVRRRRRVVPTTDNAATEIVGEHGSASAEADIGMVNAVAEGNENREIRDPGPATQDPRETAAVDLNFASARPRIGREFRRYVGRYSSITGEVEQSYVSEYFTGGSSSAHGVVNNADDDVSASNERGNNQTSGNERAVNRTPETTPSRILFAPIVTPENYHMYDESAPPTHRSPLARRTLAGARPLAPANSTGPVPLIINEEVTTSEESSSDTDFFGFPDDEHDAPETQGRAFSTNSAEIASQPAPALMDRSAYLDSLLGGSSDESVQGKADNRKNKTVKEEVMEIKREESPVSLSAPRRSTRVAGNKLKPKIPLTINTTNIRGLKATKRKRTDSLLSLGSRRGSKRYCPSRGYWMDIKPLPEGVEELPADSIPLMHGGVSAPGPGTGPVPNQGPFQTAEQQITTRRLDFLVRDQIRSLEAATAGVQDIMRTLRSQTYENMKRASSAQAPNTFPPPPASRSFASVAPETQAPTFSSGPARNPLFEQATERTERDEPVSFRIPQSLVPNAAVDSEMPRTPLSPREQNVPVINVTDTGAEKNDDNDDDLEEGEIRE